MPKKTPTTTESSRTVWTQATAVEACKLRKAGKTNADICVELDVKLPTLMNLFQKLKKAGYDVPAATRAPRTGGLDLDELGAVFSK